MPPLNILITMGGLGSRFRQAGYAIPKYMIEARGRTLFAWAMDSLLGFQAVAGLYVFLVRAEDGAADFIRTQCKPYGIERFVIVELDHLTDGQATTALIGAEMLPPDEPILIYNIDTYVEPFAMGWQTLAGDGHIPCFQAPGDHWSFVRLDAAGRAVEVREKERISDNCTLGAYYFSSAALYRRLFSEYYGQHKQQDKKEKYVAPLYDYMIKQGYEVTISNVAAEKVHVLGTPEELDAFCGRQSVEPPC